MEAKVYPIRPEHIVTRQIDIIPSFVIGIVNDLIVENYKDNCAIILQKDIVDRLVSKMNVLKRDIFGNKWLDFESLYENYGWRVEYHKGNYYDDPIGVYFKFSQK